MKIKETKSSRSQPIQSADECKQFTVDTPLGLLVIRSMQQSNDYISVSNTGVTIDLINNGDCKKTPLACVEFDHASQSLNTHVYANSLTAAPTHSISDQDLNSREIELAKNNIRNFCIREYGGAEESEDLSNIPIAYSDIENTDEELFVQVIVDLLNCQCRTYIQSENGKDFSVLVATERFSSIHQMNQEFLLFLDSSALNYVTSEEMDKFCQSKAGQSWLRSKFPANSRVMLDYMEDSQPILPDSLGTITYIDDIGNIHVNWDCGRTLALNYAVDTFHLI